MEQFQYEIICLGQNSLAESQFLAKFKDENTTFLDVDLLRYNTEHSRNLYYCDVEGQWVPNNLPDCHQHDTEQHSTSTMQLPTSSKQRMP